MIRGRRHLRWLILVAIAAALFAAPSTSPPEITISPGDDAQRIIAALPPRASVVLAAGEHTGPVSIGVPMTIRGEPGAVLVAPTNAEATLSVTGAGVSIRDLTTRGGWTGVDLLKAEGAFLQSVTVEGAELQGVRVYARSAVLDDVTVANLLDPHAQGIEVLSASDVVVRNSSVTGGKIGIVAHLSEVDFNNNHVTGTTLAAVMIREMSRGSAYSNKIDRVRGAGLYCGDMSTCAFEDNRVRDVTAVDNSRSGAGWGLVVHYRSTASSHGDVLVGAAGEAIVLGDSRMTAGPATRRGHGLGAVLPALAHSSAFVLLMLFIMALIPTTSLGRFIGSRSRVTVEARRIIVPVVLAFLVIQTFHMLEHVIQLTRVHGRGVPGRGGLAGQVVDNEWAHFLYNTVVLGGMTGILWLRRRGWQPRAFGVPDRLLTAAVIVQSYHVIEHTVKLIQHVSTGTKVAPGILGGRFDLVYLHFGINVAVYLGFAVAALMYVVPEPGRISRTWRVYLKAGKASGRPAHR